MQKREEYDFVSYLQQNRQINCITDPGKITNFFSTILPAMFLKKSTIQLLRFPFSFFLMPVFWFALGSVQEIHILRAIGIFLVIHMLLYPSSNGYNSYMDRDTGSIGGVRKPMEPTRELFYVTVAMDMLAIILAALLSPIFAVLLLCYIICSRLYSYRGVRLKQYPILGYLVVILNQGGIVFLMIYLGAGDYRPSIGQLPWTGIAAACLLIGGFYPITQIYQHRQDQRDGVKTISSLLGVRGTFVFCAIIYLAAFCMLFLYYQQLQHPLYFSILQIFFLPVLVYFFRWLRLVWKDASKADFNHTMEMNWVASTCTNIGFITLLILSYFD